jgi:molybdenum cofactor synthesis domain-containing protein
MKINLKGLTAGVLIIGDEILSGRTQDVNLQAISKHLEEFGIRVIEARVIPDDRDYIAEAVRDFSAKYKYVFTTGGIGPTHDDITAASISYAFGLKNVVNAEALQTMTDAYGKDRINSGHIQMASMPEGAQLVCNSVSVAPGFKIKNVFVMAGIPHIMKVMLESADSFLERGPRMQSKTIECFCRESLIAKLLESLQNKYEEDVEIGSYPFRQGEELGTNLVLRSTNPDSLTNVSHELFEALMAEGYKTRYL